MPFRSYFIFPVAAILGVTACSGSPASATDKGHRHSAIAADGGGNVTPEEGSTPPPPPDDAGAHGDAGSTPGSDAGSKPDVGPTAPGTPPFGGSSGGSGGAAPVGGATEMAGGVTYSLIVPSSYASKTPNPLLVVYSGTEGRAVMTMNLESLAGAGIGVGGFIFAVLDGVMYYGDGAAGATVLDDVRSKYDVDNDRTYLMGESAGTSAALQLGFHLRQSYFAAYWANDVNASDSPGDDAAMLGFHPWGQAGPGGDFVDANTIVAAMMSAGYRLPSPAPYDGAGSGSHGDPNQFVAALSFFPGKTRE